MDVVVCLLVSSIKAEPFWVSGLGGMGYVLEAKCVWWNLVQLQCENGLSIIIIVLIDKRNSCFSDVAIKYYQHVTDTVKLKKLTFNPLGPSPPGIPGSP